VKLVVRTARKAPKAAGRANQVVRSAGVAEPLGSGTCIDREFRQVS
jgi:hypothetical protein